MQVCQSRRGAGAAGTTVDGLVAIEDGITAVGSFTLRYVGPEQVGDAANGRVERMHRGEGFAQERADHGGKLEDARSTEGVQPGIGTLRLDDGVEISAIGHIDRQRAEIGDVDLDALFVQP